MLPKQVPSLARAAGPPPKLPGTGPSKLNILSLGTLTTIPSPGVPGGASKVGARGNLAFSLQAPHTFPGGPLTKCPQASEGGHTSHLFPHSPFPPPKGPFSWSPVLSRPLSQLGSSVVLPFARPGLAQKPKASGHHLPPASWPANLGPHPLEMLLHPVGQAPAVPSTEPCLLELPTDLGGTDRAQEGKSLQGVSAGRERRPRNPL